MSDPRKLDQRIDAALAAWPPVEPESAAAPTPEGTWDSMASQTLARIGGAGGRSSGFDPALSDDALLAAPLPAGDDEEVTMTAPQRPSGARLDPRSRPPGEKIAGGGQKSTRDDVPSGRMEAISPPSSREAKMTMSSEQRQRERTSFKDIAKLAETPPPGSVKPASSSWGVADQGPPSSKINPNDSGMVDLKLIAALDPRGAERAKSTPLGAAGLFEDEPPSVRGSAPPPSMAPQSAPPPSSGFAAPPSGIAAFAPSAPSLSQPGMVAEAVPASVAPVPASLPPLGAPISMAPAAPFSSAPMSARAMLASQPSAGKKKGAGLIVAIVGGVVAVSAMAAGGVLYLRAHKAAPVAVASPEVAPVEPAPVAAAAEPTPAATAAEPAPAAEEPPAPEEIALEDVPMAKSSGKPRHHHKASAKESAKEEPKPVAAVEKPKAAPKEKFAPSGGGGDLANAMKAAAGPLDAPEQTEEKPSGPQFAPGSVPQKPANGAVQGAIGAVLPNARACLGPDDPVSHATLVFGSTGTVQRVSISGGAAGKPEEKCIKQALGRAKVQPFAEPTFTTSFTVRP